MRSLWADVPLPGGRPAPSGRMLMFHAERSAALIGCPRFGDCAKAALERRVSVAMRAAALSLSVYIFHLPRALDRPAGDRVVVLAREGGDGRDSSGLAAYRDDFGSRRLHVARLVPRAALQ